MNKRIFKEEEIKDIIELYTIYGWYIETIRKKYSCKPKVIKEILLNNNIDIRKGSVIVNRFLKEDYFENIDTEEKAYLLGFITADGSVMYRNRKSNGGVLSLQVKPSDIEIIYLLKNELNCGSKIGYDKRDKKESVSVKISSTKLVQSLEKYGVVQNKTYSLDKIYDNFNNQELLRHYLTGLLDGDGCISFFDKEKSKSHVYFCSYSKKFVESFRKSINDIANILCKNKPYFVKTSYRVCWNGKFAEEVCRFLYSNCNCYLTRKYNRAKVMFRV